MVVNDVKCSGVITTFVFHRRNKVIQVWNDKRVSK